MALEKKARIITAIVSIILFFAILLLYNPGIVIAAYTDLTAEEIEGLKHEIEPEIKPCEHNILYSLSTKTATCEQNGVESTFCMKCKKLVKEFSVEKTEHQFVSIHIDATCTKNGADYEECKVCGKEQNAEIIPKQGHYFVTSVIIKNTCTEDGKEEDVCERCNYVCAERTTSKFGHNYKTTAYKDPLPNENGYQTIKCDNCGHTQTTTLYFEPKAANSIYMPTADINAKFVVGQCNQYYTDTYDITVDYNFINSTNPVMFGHNYRSLGPIYKVKVGDYIYLTENGTTTTYRVTHSEAGTDVNGGTNIKGVDTGVLCIDSSSTKTLRIFTCYNSIYYGKCRWIILAQPV